MAMNPEAAARFLDVNGGAMEDDHTHQWSDWEQNAAMVQSQRNDVTIIRRMGGWNRFCACGASQTTFTDPTLKVVAGA